MEDADLFFKKEANGFMAGEEDIFDAAVFDTIKVTAEFFNGEVAAVGFEETPGRGGNDGLGLFSKEVEIELGEKVMTVGIQRVLGIVLDKGETAVEGTKHTVHDVEIPILHFHLLNAVNVLIFFALLHGNVFAECVVILGNFRIIILDETMRGVLQRTAKGSELKAVTTPETMRHRRFWHLLLILLLDHRQDTRMFLFRLV